MNNSELMGDLVKLQTLFPKIGVRVAIPPSKGELKKHALESVGDKPVTKFGVIVGWSEKNGGTIVAKIQLDTREQVSTFQSKRLVVVQ